MIELRAVYIIIMFYVAINHTTFIALLCNKQNNTRNIYTREGRKEGRKEIDLFF